MPCRVAALACDQFGTAQKKQARLLCSEKAIPAVHQFMRFGHRQQSESGTDVTFVKGNIAALRRWDAPLLHLYRVMVTRNQ